MSNVVELIHEDSSELYSDFYLALDASVNKDTIKLLDNISLSDTILISGKDISLDLNSYSAQATHNSYAVSICNGGTFILQDTSANASGKLISKNSGVVLGTLTQYSDKNMFTMNSGMILSQEFGVLALRGGLIDLNNGTIISNSSSAIGVNVTQKYVGYPYELNLNNMSLVSYATTISEDNELINISQKVKISNIGNTLKLSGTTFDIEKDESISIKDSCKSFKVQETNIVNAVSKDKLYQSSNIFNLDTIGLTLHVKVDWYIQKNFRLMKIFDTKSLENVPTYYYDDLKRPWIDIPVDCLDLDLGLHTYTVEFVNTTTGDTLYQYFNYTIQIDNPDKPYIYMER